MADTKSDTKAICPKCGNLLSDVITTKSGRKLKRCSNGSWDPKTKKNVGCDFIEWLPMDPVELDEKCPKCGSPVVLAFTRYGKKVKKCSTNKWDADRKIATGCDFVEWITGTTEKLDVPCPECAMPLVLFTSPSGKKALKCSTSGWDRTAKKATGCQYIKWLKPAEYAQYEKSGEEFLPPETG